MHELLLSLLFGSTPVPDFHKEVEQRLPLGESQPALLHQLLVAEIDQPLPDLLRSQNLMLVAARTAPQAVALSAYIYGRWLWSQGDDNQSLPLLETAYVAFGWAGDRYGTACAAATLADPLYASGMYKRSLELVEEAVAIFRELGRAYELGKCLVTMANNYADLHDLKRADESYQTAIATFRQAYQEQQGDQQAQALIALAEAQLYRASLLEEQSDDFEQAEVMYAQVEAELVQQPFAPAQLWRSWHLLSLNRAILALRLGRHTEARRLLDQADTYLHAAGAEAEAEHFQLALYRGYQALLVEDSDEAVRLLTRARELSDARDHGQEAANARLFMALIPGTALEDARALLSEAIEQFTQIKSQFGVAIADIELARVAYRLGLPDEARAALERAEAILSQQMSPRRLLEIQLVRALHDTDADDHDLRTVAEALASLHDHQAYATVLTTLGQRLERKAQLDDARRAYREAMTAIEQARGALRLSTQSIRFLANRRLPYERAVALTAPTDPAEACMLAERARAQALLDDLVNGGMSALLDRNDPQLKALLQLRARLDRMQALQAIINVHGTRKTGETVRSTERAAIERDYTTLLDSLQAQGVSAATWVQGQAATLADIQQALDPHTAIITYLVVRAPNDDPSAQQRDLWVGVVSAQGTPVVMPVARHARLERLLTQWTSQPIYAPATTQEYSEGQLALLYEHMLKPIEHLLASVTRLIIVPDEHLPPLPLHAAFNRGNGQYLLETHTVSYAPSATVLLRCQAREAQREPAGSALVGGWEDTGASQLPFVRRDLESAGALLGTPARHGPLDIADLRTAMESVQIIHLACHGRFPPNSHPQFAHLRLGPGRNLYAHDLYASRLRADLLVLSACDSGLHGPGLQGLVSAGLVAGASTVVATMWPLDDRAAALWTPAFYMALLGGQSRAEAMRSALLTLRSQLGHPARWAPFFLTGVPDPLLTAMPSSVQQT